jgi:hypothetical protein
MGSGAWSSVGPYNRVRPATYSGLGFPVSMTALKNRESRVRVGLSRPLVHLRPPKADARLSFRD